MKVTAMMAIAITEAITITIVETRYSLHYNTTNNSPCLVLVIMVPIVVTPYYFRPLSFEPQYWDPIVSQFLSRNEIYDTCLRVLGKSMVSVLW